MQWLATVVLAILTCVTYGVIHDQITARMISTCQAKDLPMHNQFNIDICIGFEGYAGDQKLITPFSRHSRIWQ